MAKLRREQILAKVAAGESIRWEGSGRRPDLTNADLGSARYDTDTKWPEGFNPVKAKALLAAERS